MIPLKLDQLQKHLKKNQIESQFQKETDQLCILLKIAEREFPLFIRIFDNNELVQLLAFLPCNFKEETVQDTARLLHLLNKELDIPGFGMDENVAVVFYRCMIPAQNKEISEPIFDAFLNAVQVVCKSFAAVIAAVAYGAVSFEDVVKQSKEQSISQKHLKND